MSDDPRDRELAWLRVERDLYLALLELGEAEDLPHFLREALGLIVGVTGATRGYLALHEGGDGAGAPRWWTARACSDGDVASIRAEISRGIVAEALSTGRTVSTASAVDDPRFQGQASVAANRIRAVLCAPVGGARAVGVLYLQGRAAPGPFDEGDRLRAEAFATHLGPLATRLLAREREREERDPTLPYRERLGLKGMVGRSPAFADLLRQVALVAPLDVGVLLTGPTGTGKTEIARAIHDAGPRARRPFVELNCATLPENLVESELFGAMPGAHSTASRRVDGKVAAAEGGTLLLDEVAELPPPAQAKLLQLLQSRRYYRLGSTRPEVADVRVIAATRADLARAKEEGRFREDLYYRLLVLPIRVPSLGERAGDVPLLARHALDEACRRHRLPRLELGPEALAAAAAAEWPGNVRQLCHAVEAAGIRAAGEGAGTVSARHVFPDRPDPEEAGAATFQEATRRFQARLVAEALEASGGNVSEAARRLDVARSHLNDLIRAFGLRRGGP